METFQIWSDRVTRDLRQALHRDFTVGHFERLYREIVERVFSLHLCFYFYDSVPRNLLTTSLHILLSFGLNKAQKNLLESRSFWRSVASVSLFPLRRISTPHKLNIINVTTRGMLSIWVHQLSHVPIPQTQALKSTQLKWRRVLCWLKRTIVWGVVLLLPLYLDSNLLSLGKDKWLRTWIIGRRTKDPEIRRSFHFLHT